MTVKLNATGEVIRVLTTSRNLARSLAKHKDQLPVITCTWKTRYGLHFEHITPISQKIAVLTTKLLARS